MSSGTLSNENDHLMDRSIHAAAAGADSVELGLLGYYMGRDGGGGMGQREGFQLRNFRREEGAEQLTVSHFGIRIRAG